MKINYLKSIYIAFIVLYDGGNIQNEPFYKYDIELYINSVNDGILFPLP